MSQRDPNINELLIARGVIRTLDACGDNVEKKERFVAMILRDSNVVLDDYAVRYSELVERLERRNGRLFKRRR